PRLGAFLDLVKHRDSQDRAAQVVGVTRAAARVETRVHSRCVVDRRVRIRARRVSGGVVPRRQEKVAIVVECDVGTDVAALPTLSGDLEDLLLRIEVEGPLFWVELEARQDVVAQPLIPVALIFAFWQFLRRAPLWRLL